MENKRIYSIQGFDDPPAPPTPQNPIEAPEGVVTGSLPNTGLAVSLTQIETLDLISEGEIEGLVSGEYVYQGTIGNVGYSSVSFSGYGNAPGTSVSWLRSIYWDETPVVDANNQFNFQQAQISFSPGPPNGATLSSSNSQIRDEVTISRAVSERLRGGGSTFAKTYRIINPDCKSVRVNIKITALSETITSTSTTSTAATSSDVFNKIIATQFPGHTQTYGDTYPSEVDYSIYYRPLFTSFNKTPKDYTLGKQEKIVGKISYGFIKQTEILLLRNGTFINDADFLGWEIRIIRITPDSTVTSIRNQTYIDSLTEVYGDVFIYPNSAMVASKFSAEYFSQIPNRAYDARLLKVKIPSNYDPILKTYSGPWDGTFADDKAWSDNPAWCFYDMLTNSRYGLGKYVNESFVDKWTLYEIAQYCDTLVSDGEGGVEPRFTCNLYFTSRDEAYNVINTFASIFRAIVYYHAGSIYTVQDAEKDPIYLFTNANVENGDFNYSSTSKRVRHTVAIVRYNDKNNFYRPAVEYIEDVAGIRRYGIREVELSAVGCTSRGQAIRYGRWALLSESLETETVTFGAGLEGSYVKPGDIIKTFDINKRSPRLGGRIYNSVSTSSQSIVTLDDKISGLNPSSIYNFSLLTPTYNYDPSLVEIDNTTETPLIRNSQIQTLTFSGAQVSGILCNDSGVRSSITFNNGFDTGNYQVSGHLIWSIELSGAVASDFNTLGANNYDYFRLIRILEKDTNKYEIAGVQYAPEKFSAIESGLSFQAAVNTQSPNAPLSLSLSQRNLSPLGNSKIIDYALFVSNVSGVGSYLVYAKNGNWASDTEFNNSSSNYLVDVLPVSTTTGSFIPTENGTYFFRAYASNTAGNLSTSYAGNSILITDINPIKDIIISSLNLDTITGVNAPGTIATGRYAIPSPTFRWQAGLAQTVTIPADFSYRLTFRSVSLNNSPSNNIFYEVTGYQIRGIPNYRFDINDNITAVSSNGEFGPFREYDLVVEAMNSNGFSSAGGNFITNSDSDYNNFNGYDIVYVNNPRITGILLSTGNKVSNGGFSTDQWITTDGDIKIAFYSGNSPTDIGGGYVFASDVPFTRNEALGIVSTNKNIVTYPFVGNNNPITISASLSNSSTFQKYLGLSLYDSFDSAVASKGTNIKPDLDMTNVVLAIKRGAFDKQAFIYRNWAEISTIVVNRVNYIGAGIQSITYSAPFITVTFSEALPTVNYTVLINIPPATVGFSNPTYSITAKNKGSYTVLFQPPSLAGGGSFGRYIPFSYNVFFGVLYNGTS